jgi:hypothetical protein
MGPLKTFSAVMGQAGSDAELIQKKEIIQKFDSD